MQIPVVTFCVIVFGGGIAIAIVAVVMTFIEHFVSGGWWFFKRPEPGTIRRKKKFLWKPLEINGIRRHWEKAEIVQVYSGAGTMTGYDWNPAGWLDMAWGEFVEAVDVDQPRISMFGTPRGDIHLKPRDGILVVFAEKPLR